MHTLTPRVFQSRHLKLFLSLFTFPFIMFDCVSFCVCIFAQLLCKHWVIGGLHKSDKNLFATHIQQLLKRNLPWKMWKLLLCRERFSVGFFSSGEKRLFRFQRQRLINHKNFVQGTREFSCVTHSSIFERLKNDLLTGSCINKFVTENEFSQCLPIDKLVCNTLCFLEDFATNLNK